MCFFRPGTLASPAGKLPTSGASAGSPFVAAAARRTSPTSRPRRAVLLSRRPTSSPSTPPHPSLDPGAAVSAPTASARAANQGVRRGAGRPPTTPPPPRTRSDRPAALRESFDSRAPAAAALGGGRSVIGFSNAARQSWRTPRPAGIVRRGHARRTCTSAAGATRRVASCSRCGRDVGADHLTLPNSSPTSERPSPARGLDAGQAPSSSRGGPHQTGGERHLGGQAKLAGRTARPRPRRARPAGSTAGDPRRERSAILPSRCRAGSAQRARTRTPCSAAPSGARLRNGRDDSHSARRDADLHGELEQRARLVAVDRDRRQVSLDLHVAGGRRNGVECVTRWRAREASAARPPRGERRAVRAESARRAATRAPRADRERKADRWRVRPLVMRVGGAGRIE